MNNNIKYHNEEIEIDLKRVIDAVLKRTLTIILVTVLGGVLAFVVSKWIVPPKYESKVMFYVNNRNMSVNEVSQSVSTGDLAASRSLVSAYIAVLDTHSTLMEVVERAGVDYTYKEIKKMVKAQPVDGTEIFEVVVTSKDNVEADKIADAIAYVLLNKISGIIEGTSAKIVDESIVAQKPSSPKVIRWTFLGAVLAAFAAVGSIILNEIFASTIRTVEDVKQVSYYPVLVSIPDTVNDVKKTVSEIHPKENISQYEAYKILRTKLLYLFAEEKDSYVIGISSAMEKEGKSSTAFNLARSMAQLNKRVVLIDCNMRNPSVSLMLQSNDMGISDYIVNEYTYDNIVQNYSDKENDVEFSVITAGSQLINPVEILASSKMAEIIERLKSEFEYIILDLPAMDKVADTMVASKYTDGMLIISRMNYGNRKLLADAFEQLEFSGANILGVVATFG